MSKHWFHDWFNSPYYHTLYKNHSDHEAKNFIDRLLTFLQLPTGTAALDVGCGRGRHSLYLNKKGLEVIGIDLAINNIAFARRHENETLHFFVHDMRRLYYSRRFGLVLNLFTSFGYFDTDQEHINALKCMNRALKKGGLMLLDYFNAGKILTGLLPEMVKAIDGVNFHISKSLKGNEVLKTINFADNGQSYAFKEIVKAFTLDDFNRLFNQSGFEITTCFGDYDLNPFDAGTSPRLIMICKKTND